MRRVLLATLCLTAAAVTLPAQTRTLEPLSCEDVSDNNRRETHCEIREEVVAGATLDVDAGSNGGIRVEGTNGRDAHVRMMVVASARTEERAREIAGQVRLVTTGGRIRAEGPVPNDRNDRDDRNEWWYVSFEVHAPRNAQLTLNTRNGGIAIYEFEGRADFHAVNGGIALASVNGNIRGETTNGGINVDLSGSRWTGGGLDVETRNGGVRMTLPSSYSAVLEVGTVNGGLDIDFPVTVQGRLAGGRSRNLTTTLGDGGATIRAITTNGGVHISRR